MFIVGILVGLAAIYFGVPEVRDSLFVYLNLPSFILVAGGTMAATMISTSWRGFLATLGILSGWMFLKRKNMSYMQAIEVLVKVAAEAQRSGKTNVAELGKGVGDGFLYRGLQLVASGMDKDYVRTVLEIDIEQTLKRHGKFISMITTMSQFAPMFGMMGTVLGVIQVLRNVTDISAIVSGMSLALLTTLYGLVLSSLYFIPLSNKMKYWNWQEGLTKEIMVEGIMLVMDDAIPLKVEKLLMAYLTSSVKNKSRG